MRQVMAMFFHMHSHFDWSRYCWCIEGARRLGTLHSNTINSNSNSSEGDGDGDDADNSGELRGAEALGELAGYPAPLLLSQVRPPRTGFGVVWCGVVGVVWCGRCVIRGTCWNF